MALLIASGDESNMRIALTLMHEQHDRSVAFEEERPAENETASEGGNVRHEQSVLDDECWFQETAWNCALDLVEAADIEFAREWCETSISFCRLQRTSSEMEVKVSSLASGTDRFVQNYHR